MVDGAKEIGMWAQGWRGLEEEWVTKPLLSGVLLMHWEEKWIHGLFHFTNGHSGFVNVFNLAHFFTQLPFVRNLKNSYTGQYCCKVHLSWVHLLDRLLFLYSFTDEEHKEVYSFVWFSLVWFEICYSSQFGDRSKPIAQGGLIFAIQPNLALNSWKSLWTNLQSARYSTSHLKSLFSSINY